MRFFKCPMCKAKNCTKKWNEETKNHYGPTIRGIDHLKTMSGNFASYVCPECKKITTGCEIVEVREKTTV